MSVARWPNETIIDVGYGCWEMHMSTGDKKRVKQHQRLSDEEKSFLTQHLVTEDIHIAKSFLTK